MVVVDTSIIIDHLRQPVGTDSFFVRISLEYSRQVLAISLITIQEVYTGKSSKEVSIEKSILSSITPLKILPYTYEIAKLAGEILREGKVKIGFADAVIAATAIVNGAELLTLNKKDFAGIEDLELI